MIFYVEEDHEHEGNEADSGDAFDRRRSNLLDAEADLLHEHAERVIAVVVICRDIYGRIRQCSLFVPKAA